MHVSCYPASTELDSLVCALIMARAVTGNCIAFNNIHIFKASCRNMAVSSLNVEGRKI
jgi:hypothetical protein